MFYYTQITIIPKPNSGSNRYLLEQIEQYEEACQVVAHWGIMPLSSFLPDHPSLESLTRPEAWHTGLQNDPWLWRDRLPTEGVAAYGRFLAGKPLLIARELFPLVKCVLSPDETIEERYQAGLLARSTSPDLRAYSRAGWHRCQSAQETGRYAGSGRQKCVRSCSDRSAK